ncbi:MULTISPECIES: EVE domain-containing protein [unclassified Leifsonia]|uniref:EVE domain-containing protein n=1 Tax=unclassified Leifsonia TaxID=2663824 RepID=UPI001F1934C4|nr:MULTISPECIES: EVE domain-containing protein [unclassified Leifsonia]
MAIRFWLGVVQRDHVLHGVAQGIAQFNHGSKAAVSRLREADGLIYYSPRVSFPDGDPLREFTAIGRVADDSVYQATDGHAVTGGDTFRPWRRRIDYDREAQAVPIRPLLGALEFTTASPNWGYQLRRGLIELSRHDFDVIRAQMRAPSYR